MAKKNTKKKKVVTYGQVFAFLKKLATAKKMGNEVIKGNEALELERAMYVKEMEDILVKVIKKEFNGTYIRHYEHMYPKTKKKTK